ncbi:long-chain fatty acid--CoA ligase [Streptomyces radicis]|uniref:Fatty acid--CoA ligase n=1 Tax=Streptomyces radicis TaxID=1750517 RepID=A0A3A9W1V7_9ACTN|nr:long-chain fatty acid--CoA ligase [Streptomyces radicis]RKN07215.1 fatty acid--CoA ligase [Streptomyces radicis]RKN26767.1 fatty acid--CoA ligase [Streptomyces radicis]
MLGTMQDVPLLVSRILRHGATVHAGSTLTTWTGDPAAPHRRTFAETGARAARLAHALREECGVRPGDAVATLMWNNAEHVECYFAVPAMGSVLHTLNLRLPTDQLTWVVRHAADRVIVVNGTLIPLLAPLLPHLPSVEHVIVAGPGDTAPLDGARATVHAYEPLIEGRPTDHDWPELDERTPAALCYTSGTTGHPQGAVYTHRSIYLHSMQVNMAESMGLTAADTSLPVVPMFHVNAWGIPHAALMSGASLLLPDRFLQPGPLAEMIETVRPTHAAAVPSIWQGLLAELAERPRDIASLATVTIGGSACPPALMKAFDERHGVRVCHAWGMTETSPLGTTSQPPPGLSAEEEWPYRVSQGRFPAGVEARLAGPDGTFLPWDNASAGELEVRGPWIAAAYHGGPDAEPLRPDDRFSPDGWLRTGDVGVISPDGYLTLTDRAKDVIKSGGEWISSVALENHLMAHPRVAEAAVIAVPDEKWGERPLAAVVPADDGEPPVPPEELRAHLAERFPRWQLPERWTRVAAVPKTSVGKFDKKALRALHREGALLVTHLT